MTEHTQGPWKLTQESVDPEWHILTADGGRIIANIHIEPSNAMDLANARVALSAPDLLEACKHAMREINDLPELPRGREAAFVVLSRRLEEALAKAEGK